MLQSTQLKSTTTKLPEKFTAQSMIWKLKIRIPRKFINTKLLNKLKKKSFSKKFADIDQPRIQ